MKKYIIIIFLFSIQTLFGSELFTLNNSNTLIATTDSTNTIGLLLNQIIYQEILEKEVVDFSTQLPFINGLLNIKLEKFSCVSKDFRCISKTEKGDIDLDILPTLLSYKMKLNNEVIGVMNFVNGKINASFKINRKQYEITKFGIEYILFEATNSVNQSNFSCVVEEQFNAIQQVPESLASSSTPLCVDLAISIDEYTRNTFNSDQETLNWSLAIIAGVSQLYANHTNVEIQVSHSTIWNTVDPYYQHNVCGDILSELASYWQANNAGIARTLVHFMSKRGLGCGVAWLNVLCSTSNGYAVSASLNNDTNFVLPNPAYTWNLEVVAHEIGHNFGSPHTHDCGWAADPTTTPPFSGGGIDDCGPQAGYGNSCGAPLPVIGTIMSYCHLGGPGIILEFHEIVIDQALNPGIANANCMTTCDYYGCMNPNAFNYDPNATIDDSSCVPYVYGCTDPNAFNYDPNANTDDGNCSYCASLLYDITHISCNGGNNGSIDLTVTGSNSLFSYSWTGPSGPLSTSPDISGLSIGGAYTVTVTDAIGCVDILTAVLIHPDPLSITNLSTTNVSCYDGNNGTAIVSVSGGTLPYTYFWGVGVNPSSLYSGPYSVSITDTFNCPSVSEPFTITQPDVLSITIDSLSNISCNGLHDGSINVSTIGGALPYSYHWTYPSGYISSNEDINGLFLGAYFLLVTDTNNCYDSLSVNITEPTILSATYNTVDVSCHGGNDGFINVTINGGIPQYSFLWNDSITQQNRNNITAGIYFVDVTDLNGCTYPRIYFTITQPIASVITGQVTDVDCFGDYTGAIDITYTSSPTVIQNTFAWVGPNGFSSSIDDIYNLQAGLYTLTIVENSLCIINASYFIQQSLEILVSESVQQVGCYAFSSASLAIAGGTPTYIVDWGGANPQILTAGIYTYLITDQNNCTFSDTILVQPLPQILSANYTTTNVSCNGGNDGTVSIVGSGGIPPYTISLLNANMSQLSAGYYTYMIVDSFSCIYTDSFLITEPLSISVTSNTTNVSCNGGNDGTALLNISGGTSAYIVDWAGFNNSALSAGTYIYTIADGNMCDTSGSITIIEPSSIIVSSVITPATCQDSINGSAIINISGGTAGYAQNWNGLNPLTLSAGFYNLIVTDANGCIHSNQLIVPSLSAISVVEFATNSKCFGFCDGSADLTIANGVLPHFINWYGYTPDSLCEGIYFYEITDFLGCVYEDSVQIISPSPLIHNIIYTNNLLEDIVTGGTPPYTWYWWNSNTSLGGSPAITPSYNGNYYCVVRDANFCHSDTIYYFVDDIMIDINEIEFLQLVVFPNPSGDIFNISFNSDIKHDLGVRILNVIGEELINENLEQFIGEYTKQINLSENAKGVYFLEIETNDGIINKKLILQ